MRRFLSLAIGYSFALALALITHQAFAFAQDTIVPAGTLINPAFKVTSPTETLSTPSMILGTPTGILDVGAGGSDAFITTTTPGNTFGPPPPVPGTGVVGSNTNQQVAAVKPVSTGNGNYYYQHTDLSVPGRGLAVVFQRTFI